METKEQINHLLKSLMDRKPGLFDLFQPRASLMQLVVALRNAVSDKEIKQKFVSIFQPIDTN